MHVAVERFKNRTVNLSQTFSAVVSRATRRLLKDPGSPVRLFACLEIAGPAPPCHGWDGAAGRGANGATLAWAHSLPPAEDPGFVREKEFGPPSLRAMPTPLRYCSR